MPKMNTDLMNDDDLLRRYLLGELGSEQKESVEERLLADQNFFELAEAIEADLLAAYARKKVRYAERAAMKRLSATQSGQAKLTLAHALNRFGDAPETVTIPIFVQPPRRRTAPVWLRPVGTIAASLAAAVIAVAIVRSPLFPQKPMADNFGRSVASYGPLLPRRSAPRPAPQPSPASPVAAEEPTPPSAPAAEAQVFTIAFASGPRGPGGPSQAMQRLHLRPGARAVEIRIPVSEEEPYGVYRVSLTAGTTQVWSGTAKRPQGEPAVAVTVPAANLPSGPIDLELAGIHGAAEDPLVFVTFTVTRAR